jgi:hypothetical protein
VEFDATPAAPLRKPLEERRHVHPIGRDVAEVGDAKAGLRGPRFRRLPGRSHMISERDTIRADQSRKPWKESVNRLRLRFRREDASGSVLPEGGLGCTRPPARHGAELRVCASEHPRIPGIDDERDPAKDEAARRVEDGRVRKAHEQGAVGARLPVTEGAPAP